MLQVLNIPYPSGYPKNGWVPFIDNVGILLAAIFIYQFSHEKLRRHSPIAQILIMTLLLSALKEVLIRAPLMNAIVSSAWMYAFIGNLPAILTCLCIACFVVVFGPHRLGTLWHKMIAAILGAIAIQWIAIPGANALTEFLLPFVPQPRQQDAILPPYQLNVLVPAYLTYAEAVIACFILGWLSWWNIGQGPIKRIVLFTIFIMLLKRLLLAPIFYIFYSDLSPIMAVLSMGQFSLEAMALGLLSGIYISFIYRQPAALIIKESTT
ncbi:hypothetical protein CSQ89_06430 [Chitinimonas sp. BJB300]|nr:hypothetical protein CSQ89_06430 [Chitinimonas sp. BJB300]